MIGVGDKAPDFALRNQDGETVNLSDFKGRTVVLYFYPKADTPGCTTQACGIRDRGGEYEAAGAVVLGVSPDEPKALRKFADKYDLPFTLLSDEGHKLADAYGVWAEKSMYGRKYWGNERTTFVIDGGGRVTHVFPKVSPKTHDDVVLEALAA
ncbi:MAG TPA: thioredoxin-dependent thiol peroxidase [Thermoleophilaceae bacterium]|nr:thioredoxin-dependent thiol peroxidase [Thermoleophilaceae bacterium]